jgi:L-lactate dehydrogenase
VFTVSAYLEGEYEQNGIYIGVPCVLNRNGVREILEINLSNEEKEKLNISANIIEEMKKEIGL